MNVKENNNKEVIDFYNQYTTRQKQHGINARHQSIMNKAILHGLKPGHNVLEIGCGVGTQTKLLAGYLKKGTLYSCDISPENIRIAKDDLQKFSNTHCEVADATVFLIDRQFDAIIMPDVIEHIPLELHAAMFQNMAKMLKPDGFIFIHIPNPEYLEWCRINRPDLLQIIDNPVYPAIMTRSIENTGLYLNTMVTYGVWLKDGDYQYIILKKKGHQDYNALTNVDKPTLARKFSEKLHVIFRKK